MDVISKAIQVQATHKFKAEPEFIDQDKIIDIVLMMERNTNMQADEAADRLAVNLTEYDCDIIGIVLEYRKQA